MLFPSVLEPTPTTQLQRLTLDNPMPVTEHSVPAIQLCTELDLFLRHGYGRWEPSRILKLPPPPIISSCLRH